MLNSADVIYFMGGWISNTRSCFEFQKWTQKGPHCRMLVYSVGESISLLHRSLSQLVWGQHCLLRKAYHYRPIHRSLAGICIEICGEEPKGADLRRGLQKTVPIVVDTPKRMGWEGESANRQFRGGQECVSRFR